MEKMIKRKKKSFIQKYIFRNSFFRNIAICLIAYSLIFWVIAILFHVGSDGYYYPNIYTDHPKSFHRVEDFTKLSTQGKRWGKKEFSDEAAYYSTDNIQEVFHQVQRIEEPRSITDIDNNGKILFYSFSSLLHCVGPNDHWFIILQTGKYKNNSVTIIYIAEQSIAYQQHYALIDHYWFGH